MQTRVEFSASDLFAPPAEAHPHPGRALAQFVGRGLADRGFAVQRLIPEEWGWVVELENEEFPLWVACRQRGEVAGDFACLVGPSRSLARRGWRSFPAEATVERVITALRELLAATPAVRAVHWFDVEAA